MSDAFKAVQTAMKDETKCRECLGCGEVDRDGVPRLEWQSLPGISRLAYDMGMVEFKPCPQCGGTGEVRL